MCKKMIAAANKPTARRDEVNDGVEKLERVFSEKVRKTGEPLSNAEMCAYMRRTGKR
jgi:hypothetical protein